MGKHKRIKLTKLGKTDLTDRLRQNRESLKIAVILALNEGLEQLFVARMFALHPDTVAEFKKEYDQENTNWTDDDYKGSSSKLSSTQKQEVAKFVDCSDITDAKKIQEFIVDNFQVAYSLSSIYSLLHEQGFVYDYPKPILKGDVKAQEKWVKSFNRLVQKLTPDEVVLFSDAVHPTHNTQFTKVWMRQDKPKTIPTNSGRQRLNIQGSYDVTSQTGVFTEHETINAQSIIQHYNKLIEKYPDKKTIYLVQDNANYYFGEASRWLKEHNRKHGTTKIRILKIPPYSPNLNKIEPLWLLMKIEKIHNKHYAKFKEFKKAIDDFTENISRYQEKLKSFITLNFHIQKS